jgi:hypothetical protein
VSDFGIPYQGTNSSKIEPTWKKIKNESSFFLALPLSKHMPQVSSNVQHNRTRKKSSGASIEQKRSLDGRPRSIKKKREPQLGDVEIDHEISFPTLSNLPWPRVTMVYKVSNTRADSIIR